MRKTRLETAETRAKIVEAAQKEFRRQGLAGSGLTGLMAGAGLTQGGFYKHFPSKASLIEESTIASVNDLIDMLDQLPSHAGKPGGIESTILKYLHTDHRDSDTGCPYAAMGSELARQDEQVRGSAVLGFERVIDLLSTQIGETLKEAPRERALLMLCAMIGALTVSRMAIGGDLSEEVLDVTRRQLLELIEPGEAIMLARLRPNSDVAELG